MREVKLKLEPWNPKIFLNSIIQLSDVLSVSLEMQVGENCENTIHSFIILNVILKDDGVNNQVLVIF